MDKNRKDVFRLGIALLILGLSGFIRIKIPMILGLVYGIMLILLSLIRLKKKMKGGSKKSGNKNVVTK